MNAQQSQVSFIWLTFHNKALSGQSFNSALAFPLDSRSFDFITQLGASNGVQEMWIGLDNRAPGDWLTSRGKHHVESVKWNGTGPLEFQDRQCAFISYGSKG